MHKVFPGLRFVASYSGGKDSVLAIHRAIQSGMILQALLITYNTDRERSWFHGIPQEILEQVSESMGVPVRLIRTSGPEYAENFEKALRQERERGAEACVFGDIDIQGHLEWCSARCEAAGLTPCFPLWQEDRRALAEECIRSGFRPRITVVNTEQLDGSFLGRPLTAQVLDEIEAAGADACGENGEYHTFVSEGPVFARPIPISLERPLQLDGYVVAPLALRKPLLQIGCTQVYTGDGKGKTTASMGLMLRAAGAGMKIYFGQFMKKGDMSEIKALRHFLGDSVTVDQYGSGGELSGPNRERDTHAAQAGYLRAREAVLSGRYDLVVLDEIHVAVYLHLLKEEDVLQLMAEKPRDTELVLTGRYASEEVQRQADLVTEMKEVRHYFHDGIPARTGIEM